MSQKAENRREYLNRQEEAAAVAEMTEAPEAVEAPEIIEVQPEPAPEPIAAPIEIVEEHPAPTIGERTRSFFSGIRLLQMGRPQWFIAGTVLVAAILLVILAVSAFHPQGLIHMALQPAATAEPTAVTAIDPTTPTFPITPTVQAVAVVPAPVTSTVIDTITATVTITVPVEVEPVVTVTPTTAITGTLENAPEELTLLYLVREDKVVADADVSDEGAFSFGGIPDGNYDLKTKGLVTPVTVEVREGKPISELSLHNVVEGDTLWEMYRGGTWERFEEMAKELGLKWFVNDGGTPDDTTDDLLVVIIQPGQVFDLGWAPSA